MTIDHIAEQFVEQLRRDIAETQFEVRAKARNLRDDLTILIAAIDAGTPRISTAFSGRATDIERNLGRMEVAEGVLAALGKKARSRSGQGEPNGR